MRQTETIMIQMYLGVTSVVQRQDIGNGLDGAQIQEIHMRALFVLPLAFLLPGCVASVVKDVVTAPVKVVSKTADVMTTSQSEADEKR